MKNIFKNAKPWKDNDIYFTGLPRPFLDIFKLNSNKMKKWKLAKKIPVPWQSKPMINEKDPVFNVIYENEDRVIPENLCGYCGIKILDDDFVIRWTDKSMVLVDGKIQEPRVSSDTMPMHLECMKQSRIFCPYMQKTKDSEFEYGDFYTLKNNGLKDIEDIKNTPTN